MTSCTTRCRFEHRHCPVDLQHLFSYTAANTRSFVSCSTHMRAGACRRTCAEAHSYMRAAQLHRLRSPELCKTVRQAFSGCAFRTSACSAVHSVAMLIVCSILQFFTTSAAASLRSGTAVHARTHAARTACRWSSTSLCWQPTHG
jgi:hypothetical protein